MTLNQRFKRDPKEFLDGFWDINSSEPQHGEGYGIDAKGIAYLDLIEYAPNETVRVQKGTSSSVKAYYLASKVNSTQTLVLGNDADYFFTDALTGCTFIAYGSNRHNICTCHINALTREGYYKHATEEVTNVGFPVQIVFGQDEYRVGGADGEDLANVVATVVGWRKADGWHFYGRRRLNEEKYRRVLDDEAFEL